MWMEDIKYFKVTIFIWEMAQLNFQRRCRLDTLIYADMKGHSSHKAFSCMTSTAY